MQLIDKKKISSAHLCVEHVHIRHLGPGIEPSLVRLEEAEIQRFGSRVAPISEKRIRVYGERRTCLLQEPQYLLHGVPKSRVEASRRGRIRLLQHSHGMDGRDLDLPPEGLGHEGILEILHRRVDLGDEALVAGRQHLVPDGDEGDVAGGVEGKDVGGDPLIRHRWIGGEGRDLAVGRADDDGDARVREGFDQGRIGAV